jgi:transcriptional regulator of acetoin/glycerol metabolism
MPDDDLTKLRDELTEIGIRRKTQVENIGELARATERAVKRARGKIPAVEIADLVGLERTTIYRVYFKP